MSGFGNRGPRGGSTNGFGRGGFGAAKQAAQENEDWESEAADAKPAADKPKFGATNGFGKTEGNRFGEQNGGGFQKGDEGKDFGDQNGGSSRGGFNRFGERNGATNSEPKPFATGGNQSAAGAGRGSMFGSNRGGGFQGRNSEGNSDSNGTNGDASRGRVGGFGGNRPTFGEKKDEEGSTNGSSRPFGTGFGANSGNNGDGTSKPFGNRFGEDREASNGSTGGFGRKFESNTEGGSGRYANDGACRKCNEQGHKAFECPNGARGGGGGGGADSKCYNCQGTGHMSRDCTQPKVERAPREGGGEMKCYNCQGSGHMSRDCTEPKVERPPRDGAAGGGGDVTCYNCNQIGHRSRDCTEPKVGGNFGDAGDSSYADTGPSHVPKIRPIEEIFQEDVSVADSYLQIRIEDDDVTISGDGMEAIQMIENWEEANLHEKVMVNIERAKYILPRKIQSYTIPLIMDGHDVKGHAETGSGKTAAFLLPIIDTIIKKKASGDMKSQRSYPIALIIEPTRELAIQLSDQARKLADGTDVSVAVAYGKYQYRDNLRAVSLGCDILVGTPGRLKDFISKRYVLVENLKYLVLDEADQLLEDQFMRELRDIAAVDKFPKKEDRQTLLFSATFPSVVQQWANEWMREKNVMVSNKKPASANNKVVQSFLQVTESDKKDRLLKLLTDEVDDAKKANPDKDDMKVRRTLVFVKLKRTCDVLCAFIQQNGFLASTINGDRSQELREKSLEQLRNNEVNVVITTDVCARGIDIKDLDHVVNMDLPDGYIAYVHRIGRTGRLKEGYATSFFDVLTDVPLAEELVKGLNDAGQEVPEWLNDAKEGKLEIPVQAEDDKAWGAEGRPAFGQGFGGAKAAAAAPPAENDDWE